MQTFTDQSKGFALSFSRPFSLDQSSDKQCTTLSLPNPTNSLKRESFTTCQGKQINNHNLRLPVGVVKVKSKPNYTDNDKELKQLMVI